jgi:hypothetical protein
MHENKYPVVVPNDPQSRSPRWAIFTCLTLYDAVCPFFQGQSKGKVSESVSQAREVTGIMILKPYSNLAPLPTVQFEHGR